MTLYDPPPLLEVELGLRGELCWQVIDARSGHVMDEATHGNMILDGGLEAIAVQGLLSTYSTIGSSGYTRAGIREYAAVGTATAEPLAADTTLGAEVGRTAVVGPDTMTIASPTPGEYRIPVQKELPENVGNGNLREWAFATAATGGLTCKGLFKDPGGNGITVTKTSGQKLRLTHTLIATFSASIRTPQGIVLPFTGDLTDRAGQWLITQRGYDSTYGASDKADLIGFSLIASGVPTSQIQVLTAATPALAYAMTYGNTNAGASAPLAISPYVAGTHERTWGAATFDSNAANGTIYGFVISGTEFNGVRPFARLLLNSGQEFPKDNLHKLVVGGGKVTWGRA